MSGSKISIRRFDQRWSVELPRFGFGEPCRVAFDSYSEAVQYALDEIAKRARPCRVSALLGSEGRSPWTLRVGRK